MTNKKLTPEQKKEQLLTKYNTKLERVLLSAGEDVEFNKEFDYQMLDVEMSITVSDEGRGQYAYLEDALCAYGFSFTKASKVSKHMDSPICATGNYSGTLNKVAFAVEGDNINPHYEVFIQEN